MMITTHQRHQLGMWQTIIINSRCPSRGCTVPLSEHFPTRRHHGTYCCVAEEGRRVLNETAHCVRHCRRCMRMVVVMMVVQVTPQRTLRRAQVRWSTS